MKSIFQNLKITKIRNSHYSKINILNYTFHTRITYYVNTDVLISCIKILNK